ncbi:MAG: hypothetical protein M3203_07580 [Actinomycetota bacterium]|nr:hypothetical protein [Actinomycetota bacterium]
MADRDEKLARLVAETREAEKDPAVREVHEQVSRDVAAKLTVFTDLDQER